MKRFFVILGVLVLFVVFAKPILAETSINETWRKIGDKLIYEKTKTYTEKYELPPDGVSAEYAGKLIRDPFTECIVTEKKHSYEIKSICIPQVITTITKKKITYSGDKWLPEKLNSSTTKETSWFVIVLSMILPFILILSFNIISQTAKNIDDWRILVFYVLIIVVIIISGNFNINSFATIIFISILLIIGLIASSYDKLSLLIIGIISCSSIVVCTNHFFSDHSNNIIEYLIFMAFVFYVSWITAKAVKGILLWREERRTKQIAQIAV